MVDDIKHYGGTIGVEDGLIKSLEDKNDPDYPVKEPDYSASDPDTLFRALVKYHAKRGKYQDQLKKISRGGMLDMVFLKKVDRTWF